MKLPFSAKKFYILALTACLNITGGANTAFAQTITENSSLRFGKFVLVDNNASRTIQLLPGGSFIADPEYVFFIDPQMGNVTVDGYPPATPLTVTIGTTALNPVGGGGVNFLTSATFTNPAVIVTDGTGSVTFDVGATLSSDGVGTTHNDDNYDGIYSVTVTP